MTNQRGFTLLEMAMVLAVLGLLVGGGLMALGPLVERARMNQTKTNMDQIESALVLFAIRNNRLPCPADGSLKNTSTNYGLEVTQTGAGTAADACNIAAYNGSATIANSVIPWRTLGLDEQYSIDGWNNRISYFPANQAIVGVNTLVDSTANLGCLSRNTTSATRASSCDIATTGLFPSYPYGNYIAVYVAANPASNELTSPQKYAAPNSAMQAAADGGRAAYVVISHGPSGWYGWNKAGNAVVSPATANAPIKAFNSLGSAGTASNLGFAQGPPQGSTSTPLTYFDDIVRWRSPSMIIQLCGSGACGNP